jgi:hypothetical protein
MLIEFENVSLELPATTHLTPSPAIGGVEVAELA